MATTIHPPAEQPVAKPIPDRVQAVGTSAHLAHVAEEVPQPRWIESFALFVLASVVYFWIGYTIVVGDGVVVFDALDRMTRAYMVWHNEPPKLAAIGFVFPPLTTMVFLPFTLVKPLATSLVALPLASAMFGGALIVAVNRLFARCSMPRLQRWLVLVVFALNPLLVFYAGNGMSELASLALLAFSLYCFTSWVLTTQPRFLVAAGMAFALLVLLRYSFAIWALVIAVMIAIGLGRRGAQSDETEGTLITFLAPLTYALGVWILFNWLIVGDPFSWLSGAGSFAVNAPQSATAGGVELVDVLERTWQLALGVFALGIVVVPALIFAAISKPDQMALWLAILAFVGIAVVGVGAVLTQDRDAFALRNAMPILIVCVAGVAWLYRILPNMRTLIFIGALVGLVLTAIGSWIAMRNYPFQSQEQAFTRAIATGSDQDGTNSIGGFRVGTKSEEQAAAYINANVDGRSSILADNAQTFGVMLLSGRPETFFDRVDKGDETFRDVARRPYGRVDYLLVAKQVSGDLIRRRYPTAAGRRAAGFSVVLETERYVLLAVPDRDPRRPRTPAAAAGAAVGGAQVGGRAQGSDGTPATGGAVAP